MANLDLSRSEMAWAWDGYFGHPLEDEIIRHVEFYFGNDNLPEDAHLLALTGGDGNGPVSIDDVLNLRRLRPYAPKEDVIEALRRSKLMKMVGDHHIMRRWPLMQPLRVPPESIRRPSKWGPPVNKPWLTKGMMKPTGFELDAEEILEPGEAEADEGLYHPSIPFASRIESAIAMFKTKRKFHDQQTAVFEKLMKLGGLTTGPRMFTGRITQEFLDRRSKEEIAEILANNKLAPDVFEGLADDEKPASASAPTWVVDFEGVAKCFLSTTFLENFRSDAQSVRTSIHILRNFYRYLMLHKVCPEFHHQLVAACDVCNAADRELPGMVAVGRYFPGDFNKACSQTYAATEEVVSGAAHGNWHAGEQETGWSAMDAKVIIISNIAQYGNEDQCLALNSQLQDVNDLPKILTVTEEETVFLTIVSKAPVDDEKARTMEKARDELRAPGLKPSAFLLAQRQYPSNPPPADADSRLRAESYCFKILVDETTLEHCYVGLEFEAHVKTLSNGMSFIDRLEAILPSYFTWLPNERVLRSEEEELARTAARRQQEDSGSPLPLEDLDLPDFLVGMVSMSDPDFSLNEF